MILRLIPSLMLLNNPNREAVDMEVYDYFSLYFNLTTFLI